MRRYPDVSPPRARKRGRGIDVESGDENELTGESGDIKGPKKLGCYQVGIEVRKGLKVWMIWRGKCL